MISASLVEKREALINKILLQQPVDLETLYSISRLPGGFVSNKVRTRVWPKLLNVNRYSIPDFRGYVENHRDTAQVICDVDRSLWNYKHIKGWEEELREKRRLALSSMIMSILCRHSSLHYYQGYHDVVSVFLLVLEEDHLAFALAEVVSLNYLSDFMCKDFEIVAKSMQLIMVILRIADKDVYSHLKNAGIEPFFATSWLITWFSHDVKDCNESARIFDAMLCSHPLFCIYLCASLVIFVRDEVLSCECDFATLHNMLAHVPDRRGLPFEELLPIADELMDIIPPSKLCVRADSDLRKLIEANSVNLFLKPSIPRYVDADWILLQNMRMEPSSVQPSTAALAAPNETKRNSTGLPSLDKTDLSLELAGRVRGSISWGWARTFAALSCSSSAKAIPDPGATSSLNDAKEAAIAKSAMVPVTKKSSKLSNEAEVSPLTQSSLSSTSRAKTGDDSANMAASSVPYQPKGATTNAVEVSQEKEEVARLRAEELQRELVAVRAESPHVTPLKDRMRRAEKVTLVDGPDAANAGSDEEDCIDTIKCDLFASSLYTERGVIQTVSDEELPSESKVPNALISRQQVFIAFWAITIIGGIFSFRQSIRLFPGTN